MKLTREQMSEYITRLKLMLTLHVHVFVLQKGQKRDAPQ